MSKILYNSPIIKIPDEFAIITKNNKVKVVKSLKNNNLKTIKKKKPIQIIEDKDIDKIIIESQGRKIDIDNNDLGLKKMLKEKKPRIKKDKKLIETARDQKKNLLDFYFDKGSYASGETTINKKPTIKVSNPIITEHKKEDEQIDIEKEKNKKKIIENYLKKIKKNKEKGENYRQFFHNYKPGEDFDYHKKEEYIDFKDRYLNKNFLGFENPDYKIIKEYSKTIGFDPRKGLSLTLYKDSKFKDEYDKLLKDYYIYKPIYKRINEGYEERLKTNKTKKATKSKDHIEYEKKINKIREDMKKLLEDNKEDIYVKDLIMNDNLLKDLLETARDQKKNLLDFYFDKGSYASGETTIKKKSNY